MNVSYTRFYLAREDIYMLTKSQKYSIATLLATNSYTNVVYKLKQLQEIEGIEFAEKIKKYFTKCDGFIPRSVIKLCNE